MRRYSSMTSLKKHRDRIPALPLCFRNWELRRGFLLSEQTWSCHPRPERLNRRRRSMPDRRAISVFVLLMMSVNVGLAQYPAKSQIVKDGTAVMIEDYIDLPISTPGP